MGYKAKDRIGDRSGDLEIIKRDGRTESREIIWLAVCKRVRADGSVCGNKVKVPTHRIGSAMCIERYFYNGEIGISDEITKSEALTMAEGFGETLKPIEDLEKELADAE